MYLSPTKVIICSARPTIAIFVNRFGEPAAPLYRESSLEDCLSEQLYGYFHFPLVWDDPIELRLARFISTKHPISLKCVEDISAGI